MGEELYRENILDHSKHPRNKRKMDGATFRGEGRNASCGDEIFFFVKLEGNKIADASFDGMGCAISLAAASMLTEKLIGKTVMEAKMLTPGDIYNLLGVKISPGRVNCALLAYEALEQGLRSHGNA